MDILDSDDVEEIAGLANNVAHVATAIADVTFSGEHGKIPVLIEDWIKAEHALTALNQKDSNEGLAEADEAERSTIEREFAEKVVALMGKPDAIEGGYKIEFPGEPRGPAIRVCWDNCPSNSLGGGLIIPLP